MTNKEGIVMQRKSFPRNPFRWSKKSKTKLIRSGEAEVCENKIHNATQTNEEVIVKVANNSTSVKRSSSFVRRCLTRFIEQVSPSNKIRKPDDDEEFLSRVPPLNEYYHWPSDQIPGVTGLKNHGNTCFINAVLQCLSHTDLLAEYFVTDQYKSDLKRRNKLNSRKFGTKGELTEELANVLKALWMCKKESEHSTSFKAAVDRHGSQFRSSTQHDAQEFLLWLMDKVHEDLNTAAKRKYKSIKNNYGRSDEIIAAETLANHIRCNNSFVQTVFQAQFRSSLTCPQCKKQSNTFDPFHCISVQLPQLTQQVVFVTVLYAKQHPKQVKLGITVPAGSPISSVREQLQSDTNIETSQIVLAEINDTGFSKIFYDYQPCSLLNGLESFYCIEMPDMKKNQKNATTEMSLMLLVVNLKMSSSNIITDRFGMPFCIEVDRDYSYIELQKKILREMSSILKPEVFSYKVPLHEMFRIRLQDPSADPDTYLENVEHPLFTEMIDLALSLASCEAGPPHIKLLLEWNNPELFFNDILDHIVEHESVPRLRDSKPESSLSLEQCLEHYTKAETLSLEDAWRCPHCQKYLPVVKKLGLWSLPDILVIHLKRFRQHQEKGQNAAKLTTLVKFPLHDFDMSPHLSNKSSGSEFSKSAQSNFQNNSAPWKKRKNKNLNTVRINEQKDTSYDLYAVCYHQGDTLETGHYTAACKNPYNNDWYRFDDQKVFQVKSNEIEDDIVNNDAYILFYQRKDKTQYRESSCQVNTSVDHWVSKIYQPEIKATITVHANNESEEVYDANDIDIKSVNQEIEVGLITENNKHSKIDVSLVEDSIALGNEIEVVPLEINDTRKLEETEVVTAEPMHEECESKIPIDEDTSNSSSEEEEQIPLQTSSSASAILRDRTTSISQFLRSQRYIHSINSNYATITSSASNQLREAFSESFKSNSGILSCVSERLNDNSNYFNLRHSFSTNSTISMLRNNPSTCSKVLFIDQHHGLLSGNSDVGENGILENRTLWISPVTPHKLITVSPKN